MATVNTNVGAQIALQSLNRTSSELAITQNRVSTGLKISSAKDNGAIYAIAAGLRAESGALDAVKNSLNRGKSIIDVGLAAGENILASLEELKALAVNIQASASGAAKTAYEADFDAIKATIDTAIANAKFDGVSILASAAIDVLSDTSGGTLTVGAGAQSISLTNASSLTDISAAIDDFGAALATLGTQSKTLDRQLTFISKLQDATDAGVGNLVDADLAKESARLTALQTKQQLGVQALSIANQAPAILLSLFR